MGRLMTGMGTGLADALRPLSRLRQELERAFDGLELPAFRALAVGYPALNTWEDDASAYVEAELPGVAMDQVEVSVTGNELTIRGERKADEPPGAQWHRKERPAGMFARTTELPWEIDAARVEARSQDGVLTVKLPKAESAKPRKVKVVTS
jgi:HSP20 family protein